MKVFLIVTVTLIVFSAASAQTPAIPSKDNHTGNWTSAATWTNNTAQPTTTVGSASYQIFGYVTVTGNLTFTSTGALDVQDTLVVAGNLVFQSTAALNIGAFGVLVVKGNFTSNSTTSIASGGRIVVTGNYSMTAGSNSVYNTGAMYLFDTTPDFGGASYSGNAFKNQSDLANNDPSLNNFVSGAGLPVVLLSFSAIHLDEAIELTWITVKETNNERFEIEKSEDGIHFETLAIIFGNLNRDEKSFYVFKDQQVRENNYYRLKQVDRNGESETFYIIHVAGSDNSGIYKVYDATGQLLGNFAKFKDINIYNKIIIINRRKYFIQNPF